MTDYEAVIYDLDGTIVTLDVDWSAVATDVIEVYHDAGVRPAATGLWDLLERAGDAGLAGPVEETIAAHERAGARTSTRLTLASALADHEVPVGVCSLNCEQACRIALDVHDLKSHVDAIVGRDTVGAWKPDPEPLLAVVERLSASPASVLFVGDSPRDELTAQRAGTDFIYVDERPTPAESE